ncbi:hypothetical protein SDC9_176343 [bioreactor metagenome]|uniref:Uncharacterized protein n=1 Tax=bioreactor metagenome TaxID=1076179 RepID=A0A645GPQ4_9ZZZZ
MSAQEVPAARVISDFIGAVLPDLTDNDGIRLFLPRRPVEARNKIVGKFVRHIQPPTVRAGAQPAADNAVFIFNNIIYIG